MVDRGTGVGFGAGVGTGVSAGSGAGDGLTVESPGDEVPGVGTVGVGSGAS